MESAVDEEMMALESIFYDSFTKISDNRFRVRIDPTSEDDDSSSPPALFIDISLPEHYPDDIPKFDISNINNNAYPDFVKKAILRGLDEQASNLTGESMCYTLVEWLKDKLPEFHSLKPTSIHNEVEDLSSECVTQSDGKDLNSGKKEAKEKLTKAQKRRYFDRFGANAEKPRGWDWVSIISHLSQVPQHGPSS